MQSSFPLSSEFKYTAPNSSGFIARYRRRFVGLAGLRKVRRQHRLELSQRIDTWLGSLQVEILVFHQVESQYALPSGRLHITVPAIAHVGYLGGGDAQLFHDHT
ncbi:hypothetical protein LZ31DRAFT_306942 [Colletotrichum somersetense]|nr:hypothetical protein LZ31DRAFT_306942 [Colletotrichum somersetense]